ncbi:MAG: TspO/MBR family protein [Bacteroidales bacterium]|jgi:hypothetical protein|nr:TspO/MBR family protein [Bacteroidales bacterium]
MIKYINILLFVVMIVMNYLANALPLNNKTTGELSDSFPNLFVPAGLTFSIWGIIYLLLFIYVIMQFTGADRQILNQTVWLFGVTCALNALWIVFWHYGNLPISMIVMLGLLGSLIAINTGIKDLSPGIIKAVFGIYLGWICIATIANATALLVHYNWQGSGISEEAWTIIMIGAGAVITISALYKFNNPYIGLSVVWAFIGIAIKRQDDFRSIFIAAIIAIVLTAIFTILGFLRKPAI